MFTNHRAIEWLFSARNITTMYGRWWVFLELYDITIVYRKGSLQVKADVISRSLNHIEMPIVESDDGLAVTELYGNGNFLRVVNHEEGIRIFKKHRCYPN